MTMPANVEVGISEIKKRIEEYHKHKNDSYAYDFGEIEAVREVHEHAVEDLEFLLSEMAKLKDAQRAKKEHNHGQDHGPESDCPGCQKYDGDDWLEYHK